LGSQFLGLLRDEIPKQPRQRDTAPSGLGSERVEVILLRGEGRSLHHHQMLSSDASPASYRGECRPRTALRPRDRTPYSVPLQRDEDQRSWAVRGLAFGSIAAGPVAAIGGGLLTWWAVQRGGLGAVHRVLSDEPLLDSVLFTFAMIGALQIAAGLIALARAGRLAVAFVFIGAAASILVGLMGALYTGSVWFLIAALPTALLILLTWAVALCLAFMVRRAHGTRPA